MSRKKLFIENFFFYGIGGTISKAIPLIMLPIITRLMPETFYFGLNDLATTIISFGSSIAIMGMYDALFRMFFEKDDEEYKKDLCSTAFIFTCITSLIIFIILILFKDLLAKVVFGDTKYVNLIFLSAISILIGSNNLIIAAPTRMQNKKKTYLLINIISSAVSYLFAIPMLINKWYVIALPLSNIISSLSVITIYYCLNKKWFDVRKFNKKYLIQMLKIGLPLVPNFIIYWIFNSSDKLMIANFLGNEQNGIYAIGSKLGHISQLVYTAFAGGWQYFAFSTMKDEDQVRLTSKIFEYLGLVSFITTMCMMCFSDLMFKILFTGDYVKGTIVAPYLFLAPLLLMLYQVLSSQFVVIKKTWPNLVILGSGAVFNIIANCLLIPLIGIEGAAVATLLGYAISLIIGVIVLTKIKYISINPKFYIVLILFITYSITWRFIYKDKIIISFIIAIIFIAIMTFIYKNDLLVLLKNIKNRKGEKDKSSLS